MTFALEVPAETQLLGMAQNAPPDRYRPRHYIYAYPLAVDERVPANHVKLFDVPAASAVPVCGAPPTNQLYGFGTGPHFEWAADSSSFRYSQTDRGYTAHRLLEVDASTGAVRTVVEEADALSVNTGQTGAHRIGDCGDVLWRSERDGNTHLYYYSADGTLRCQLTKGDWQVRAVEWVDAARRRVFFSAVRATRAALSPQPAVCGA